MVEAISDEHSRLFALQDRLQELSEGGKDVFYNQYDQLTPKDHYGPIHGAAFFPEFEEAMAQQFAAGYEGAETVDRKIDEWIDRDGYGSIYVAKSDREDLPEAEQETVDNHKPAALDQVEERCRQFIAQVHQESDRPYADIYVEAAERKMRAANYLKFLSQPEYTRERLNLSLECKNEEDGFASTFDIDRSLESGTIVMPYEEAAVALLSVPGRADELTVKVALDRWQLTDEERGELALAPDAEVLEAEEIKRLFNILLKRANLADWKIAIVNSATAMDCNSKSKTITIPKNRKLSGDEAVYNVQHELVHVLRGENGSRQQLRLLQVGTKGYFPTEEGVTTLCELIAGEPFGHRRQREFAARYLAVAMSLKAELGEEGQWHAKHTWQDIYNKLRDYNIPPKTAYKTVLRVARGTSLRREVVQVDFEREGKPHSVFAAETYTKDAVYFRGQMELYDLALKLAPLAEKYRDRPNLTKNRDFSTRLLVRIGKTRLDDLGETIPSDLHGREAYQFLVAEGRETLYQLLDFFGAGKCAWNDYLKTSRLPIRRSGLVSYADFLEPKNK